MNSSIQASTATTGRTVLALGAILSLLLALFGAAAARPGTVLAAGDHCPSDTNGAPSGAVNGAEGDESEQDVSITYSGDPGVVTLTNNNDTDATVVFCAKGGNEFEGDNKNSGEITATLAPDETQTFEFGTEISYFVLYSVTVDQPEEPGGEEPTVETCPASTTLLVTFTWTGSTFVPDGGDAMGVSVTGDTNLAYFMSTETITALVVSAGGDTRNITLDFPSTTGSISPHNYEVFGGASMSSLGFCVGPKVNPDSGSRVSVEIDKDAECAALNTDGTATVTGTIKVDNHGRWAVRLTSALDTVLSEGDQALARTTIDDLVGVELAVDEVITVDYAITFEPQGLTSFVNFIEVTIERLDNGEARHKVYNDRAAFVLCDEGEEPAETVQVSIMKHLCDEVTTVAEFNAVENAGAGGQPGGFGTAPGLVATVLACPTIVLTGDVPKPGAITNGNVDFDFSVVAADGTTQILSSDGDFMQQALCEDVVMVDVNENGMLEADVCLDTSMYTFEVVDGTVVISETEVPEGSTGLGTIRFTPGSEDETALATSIGDVEATGVITL
ncbi:MAG: hypothetical protein H0X68_05775, partial [Chloroflexi bacterium]|nr:hypothetical protein [Chloroflexota bacterium]